MPLFSKRHIFVYLYFLISFSFILTYQPLLFSPRTTYSFLIAAISIWEI